MASETEYGEEMIYIRSLKDPVKRRFAVSYLGWVRAGRTGSMPARGALSSALAKAVTSNIDALI